ncbi:MAG TPA: hypothetical protein VN614_06420 [Rhodanobacter sp.]|jgi:hypothetical protein|nr:hypothetical protein [Rhodanobacter sp.]
MIIHTRKGDGVSVAAIFAAGWFIFLLVADASRVNIDFTGTDLMMVWVCYFIFVSIVASIFLMRPNWMIKQLHVWILGIMIGVGSISAIKLHMSGVDIVPDLILSTGFAVIGFLFAKVFDERIKRRLDM